MAAQALNAMVTEVHSTTTSMDGKECPYDHAPAQGEIFCLSTLFPFGTEPFEDDPIQAIQHAMAASTDPDTLYYHQAKKEPDFDKFKEGMVKEIVDQWDNGNFTPVLRTDVPKGEKVVPGCGN